VNDRSDLIAKLQANFKTRATYINAKVSTLVPSQIRGLRLKSETPRQPDLAAAAHMHQSRISMLETAGANPTIATLSEIAAALKVGLKVEFVPFSEMLTWENNFRQDEFQVITLDRDQDFLAPVTPQGYIGYIATPTSVTTVQANLVNGAVATTGGGYSIAGNMSLANAEGTANPDLCCGRNIPLFGFVQSFNSYSGPQVEQRNKDTDSTAFPFFAHGSTYISAERL
jgi:transcriptional regulator with XRE-family HTH domain